MNLVDLLTTKERQLWIDFKFYPELDDDVKLEIMSLFLIDPDPQWIKELFTTPEIDGGLRVALHFGDRKFFGSGGFFQTKMGVMNLSEEGFTMSVDGVPWIHILYANYILNLYGTTELSQKSPIELFAGDYLLPEVTMEVEGFEGVEIEDTEDIDPIYLPLAGGKPDVLHKACWFEFCIRDEPMFDLEMQSSWSHTRHSSSGSQTYIKGHLNQNFFDPIFRELLLRSFIPHRLTHNTSNSIVIESFDVTLETQR